MLLCMCNLCLVAYLRLGLGVVMLIDEDGVLDFIHYDVFVYDMVGGELGRVVVALDPRAVCGPRQAAVEEGDVPDGQFVGPLAQAPHTKEMNLIK